MLTIVLSFDCSHSFVHGHFSTVAKKVATNERTATNERMATIEKWLRTKVSRTAQRETILNRRTHSLCVIDLSWSDPLWNKVNRESNKVQSKSSLLLTLACFLRQLISSGDSSIDKHLNELSLSAQF